jgi:hypothetical protein
MAIVKTGESLTSPEIQPGWTVSNDGFGLVTSTTRYKADFSFDVDALTDRGTAHPDATYSFLKAHKYSISWDSLEIATVTVDYVGIDPDSNEGEFTQPNTSAANGLTAEHITTHPNFFEAQTGFIGALAGPAPYTQDTPNNLAPMVNGAPAYIGLNGACFEKPNGGRFIGFVDPEWPQYYGKTQYLAPTTTYSGVIYVADQTYVIDILGYLGKSTETTAWGTWDLLPDWAPVGSVAEVGPKNLLSQVNVEEYGSLYKVMYEIRYNVNGWDSNVYKEYIAE